MMGFRSVGNLWIVLATCGKDLAGSFSSVTMLSIFMGILFFCSSFQENLQSQFSSWRVNLWIRMIQQLRIVSVFCLIRLTKNSLKWNLGPFRDVIVRFEPSLVRVLTSALLLCSAFTTKLRRNSQEYVLEVVDTAGQVHTVDNSLFKTKLKSELVFNGLHILVIVVSNVHL